MAETDWEAFTSVTNGALDAGSVSKGVTAGFTVPGAIGTNVYCHGFNSLLAVNGFAGHYYKATNFNPIATGKCGSVRGALRRYSAGSGYAPMLGFLAGTHVTSNTAYFLALSNSSPYQIVLAKAIPGADITPASATVLRRSAESFASTTLWHHVRLDVLVNPHGEVRLNVYGNDLDAHDVDAPTWEAIPGMDAYIDDSLGVLSGTPPLLSGFRAFFGQYTSGSAGKVSLFDHIEVYRQTSP